MIAFHQRQNFSANLTLISTTMWSSMSENWIDSLNKHKGSLKLIQNYSISCSNIQIYSLYFKMRQDQKQTPSKYTSRSYKKKTIDQALSKDLLCPFLEVFSPALFSAYTPIRKQPDYLLSPSPIKKDLFSQLLGTQTKYSSPIYSHADTIQQENITISDISQQSSNSMMEECSSQNEANWSQQNGLKKRKRKSTAQIKLLKQELNGEMNWTKEKIVRMAQVTGLSQSQVYKWCWDQKKKQNKTKGQSEKNIVQKRRFIKKKMGYRGNQSRYIVNESQSEELQRQKKRQNMEINSRCTLTKLKSGSSMIDSEQTQKKVQKRLIFY